MIFNRTFHSFSKVWNRLANVSALMETAIWLDHLPAYRAALSIPPLDPEGKMQCNRDRDWSGVARRA